MEYAALIIYYAVLAILAILAGYGIVRAASFAYYRTKLEHFRRVRREIGDENGEEV